MSPWVMLSCLNHHLGIKPQHRCVFPVNSITMKFHTVHWRLATGLGSCSCDMSRAPPPPPLLARWRSIVDRPPNVKGPEFTLESEESLQLFWLPCVCQGVVHYQKCYGDIGKQILLSFVHSLVDNSGQTLISRNMLYSDRKLTQDTLSFATGTVFLHVLYMTESVKLPGC